MMIARFADGTGTIVLGIIPKWRKIFRLVKYDMMATPQSIEKYMKNMLNPGKN